MPKIEAIHRVTRATLVPSKGPRGFTCAKGGNKACHQVFVPTLADVLRLLKDGWSVRMSATGVGWGNLRSLSGISVS